MRGGLLIFGGHAVVLNQLKRRPPSMTHKRSKGIYSLCAVSFFLLCFSLACKNAKPPEKAIANTPEELEIKATDIIQTSLDYAAGNDGKIDDSIRLGNLFLVQSIYENNEFTTLWSNKEQWTLGTDSLRQFIAKAKLYGLFPEDYHFILSGFYR